MNLLVPRVSTNKNELNLCQHLNLFLEINPQGSVIIALNKADLIPQEKLAKLIELYGSHEFTQVIKAYATSAKTGSKVNQILYELSDSILARS